MTIEPRAVLTFVAGLVIGLVGMYYWLFTSTSLQMAKINGTVEAIGRLAPNCTAPFQQPAQQEQVQPQPGPK